MNEPMATWERRLAEELAALPDIPAPPSLAPRVMAALACPPALPWWKKPWLQWPAAPRWSLAAAGALLAIACVGALAWASRVWGGLLWDQLVNWSAPALDAFELVRAAIQTAARVVRAGGWALWAALASWAVMSYLACLGFGTACLRLLKSTPL